MPFKPAPLNSAFFATSIIGILITIFYVFYLSTSWGTAFIIIFSLMFIASLISMRKGAIIKPLKKKKK
ncbi:hypothetical protein KY314_02450 [Candidatus Woesearchaeota archaeon]|nr:hypothetical protein [Candidatus Woesearchaeota archaeon]